MFPAWDYIDILLLLYNAICLGIVLLDCNHDSRFFNWRLHFYTYIPPMKDHHSYKTTFCGPMGGLKSQVSLYIYLNLVDYTDCCIREEFLVY